MQIEKEDPVEENMGLSTGDAQKLMQQYGKNVVSGIMPSLVALLARKFWGVIPWMLEAVLIIDLVLGRWTEAVIIGILLLSNALLGFMQENRASQAVALLRQRLSIDARVRRDGAWQKISAKDLVPGDLVHVRIGDILPADIRIIGGQIQIDQSQLTGESRPVNLEAEGTAYAGSAVIHGEADGIVSETGARSYYGKAADLVRTAEAPQRLETLVIRIAKYLGMAVVFFAIIAIVVMAVNGTPLSEMLPFGVMLLATSVPVALPMMFTVSAALGARGLAEKGVLITRLSAIELAASMDILCIDKTGTLTENRLVVSEFMSFLQKNSDELLKLAALASDEATQDPIDLAILRAAQEHGLMEKLPERINFIPFEPNTKYSEAAVRQDSNVLRVIKGAPETLAEMTRLPWKNVADSVERLSSDGSRVLAVAFGIDNNLTFAGLVVLSDQLFADSSAFIEKLRELGVRVLLVTGDGEATARAVAAKVGISGKTAPKGILQNNPDAAIQYEIFAGVLPEEKYSLIKALQNAGHVVGMTGDGVNDAPALRQADIGIAVAGAADVAKAAAGLVLTRPGLSEILKAVSGSRMIFQRMKNFVFTMISMKLSTPIFLSLGIIVFGLFMLTPLQIVLLMLLGNFVTMSVSMDQVNPSPKPDRWNIRQLMAGGIGLASLSLSFDILVFWISTYILHLQKAQTQTLVFFWLVIGAGQALLYITRGRRFFWERPYPGRVHLLITLIEVAGIAIMAIWGCLMAAVLPQLVGGLLALVLVFLLAADLIKIILMRFAS